MFVIVQTRMRKMAAPRAFQQRMGVVLQQQYQTVVWRQRAYAGTGGEKEAHNLHARATAADRPRERAGQASERDNANPDRNGAARMGGIP